MNTPHQSSPSEKLGSIRQQRIAQRKEMEADQRAFVKIFVLSIVSFLVMLATLLVPDAMWQYIDDANQLIIGSIAWWIIVIIGLKLIVGKRKMW